MATSNPADTRDVAATGPAYWARVRSFRRAVLDELAAEYGASVRAQAVAAADDGDRVGPVELARRNGHPLRHAHVDVVALDWIEYAGLH